MRTLIPQKHVSSTTCNFLEKKKEEEEKIKILCICISSIAIPIFCRTRRSTFENSGRR
jgi:hypothetical protein